MNDILYPADGLGQPTIGVDVAKKTLEIAGLGDSGSSIPNTPAACRRLAKRLGKISPRVVAVEATGGYEHTLVVALWKHRIPVAILQPSRVRAYAKASGQLAKTDAIDAAGIADFACSQKIRLAQQPSPAEESLDVLCNRRGQIVQDRVREIGRLEAVRDATMRREIQRQIKHLKKLECDLDQRIASLIESDELMRSKRKTLRQERGIGPTISATLLAKLPELGTVNRQVIAALAGLAPYANESGNWRGKRTIFGGRTEVRRALYLAAMSAIRHEGPTQTRYKSMLARGKRPKVALIACARKMLVYLNVQMAEHLADVPSPTDSARIGA